MSLRKTIKILGATTFLIGTGLVVNHKETNPVLAEEHNEICEAFNTWFDETINDDSCLVGFYLTPELRTPEEYHFDCYSLPAISSYDEALSILDRATGNEYGSSPNSFSVEEQSTSGVEIYLYIDNTRVHKYEGDVCVRCGKERPEVGEHSGLYLAVTQGFGDCLHDLKINGESVNLDTFLTAIDAEENYSKEYFLTDFEHGGIYCDSDSIPEFTDVYFAYDDYEEEYIVSLESAEYIFKASDHEYDSEYGNVCNVCGAVVEPTYLFNAWNDYYMPTDLSYVDSLGNTYDNSEEFLNAIVDDFNVEKTFGCNTSMVNINFYFQNKAYFAKVGDEDMFQLFCGSLINIGAPIGNIFINEECDAELCVVMLDEETGGIAISNLKGDQYLDNIEESKIEMSLDKDYDYILVSDYSTDQFDSVKYYLDFEDSTLDKINTVKIKDNQEIESDIFYRVDDLNYAQIPVEVLGEFFGALILENVYYEEEIEFEEKQAILKIEYGLDSSEGLFLTKSIFIDGEIVSEETEFLYIVGVLVGDDIEADGFFHMYFIDVDNNNNIKFSSLKIIDVSTISSSFVQIFSIERDGIFAKIPKDYSKFGGVELDTDTSSETYGHLFAIYVEKYDETDFIKVDLGKVIGEKGDTGEQGIPGQTPQLRINETTNMWEASYDNGTTWTSLNVKAKGENGENGANGITPQLRINETTNMWEVSYDNGRTWTSLNVKATGENGENGKSSGCGGSIVGASVIVSIASLLAAGLILGKKRKLQ